MPINTYKDIYDNNAAQNINTKTLKKGDKKYTTGHG